MALKIIAGSAIIITGIISETMALLFIIASSGVTSRITSAGLFFIAGLPLLISGFRLFKSGMILNPAVVRKKILKAAAKYNGEVSKTTMTGETGWNDIVESEINKMIKNRTAVIDHREGEAVYIFPGFQFTYIQNKCPFCGNDYAVRDDVKKCPTCGGDLKLMQKETSSGGENFSMDS